MKKMLISLCLFSAFLFAKAQSITPATNGVYCPGVSTTFTITMPAAAYFNFSVAGTSATGIANSDAVQITSNPTMQSNGVNVFFTFTGFFRDVPKAQGLIFSYKDGNGNSFSNLFVYTNFFSFNPIDNRERPQTNLTSIQATSCQTQSFNISFPLVQFYPFNPGQPGYAAVNSYQYLLPTGWQLSGATSDGVSWLPGSNNVTVTSDATHGGAIQVRGVPCSPNLTYGPASSISITRPAQTTGYSISGVSPLCSGTTATFTLNGLQAGSSVAWSTVITPAGIITYGQPNSAVTTVTGGSPFPAILAAQITDACGASFTLTSPLQVGVLGAPTTMYANGNAITGFSTDVQRTAFVTLSIDPVPGATSYFWSIGSNAILNAGQGTSSVDVLIIGSPGNSTSFSVQPTNECGNGGGLVIQGNIIGDGGCDFWAFQASPNPVKSDLYVTIGDSVKSVRSVKTMHASLYNFHTNQQVKSWELRTGQKQYHLNVAGVKKGQYVLQIVVGNEKRTKQVLID